MFPRRSDSCPARIDRGVDVPFDGGELGEASLLHRSIRTLELRKDDVLIGQQMNRCAERFATFWKAGEARELPQTKIDLQRRAIRAQLLQSLLVAGWNCGFVDEG